MQWLARPVVAHLDKLVVALHGEGADARRDDVVGLLVLKWEGVSSEALSDLIWPFKKQFANPRSRRADGAVPVRVHLPSPISLRVDAFVEIARKRATVYRHDVIGALIMNAEPNAQHLVPAFNRYRHASAGEAVPPDVSKKQVLAAERPAPGPRPHRRKSGARA
jgi:hypothetical protein